MQRCEQKNDVPYNIAELQDSGETMMDKYLIFRCGQQMMGIHISEVKQIIQMPQITPLPDYPNHIKGITCMHGEATMIMDMRLRLGKPEEEQSKLTCVIIFSLEKCNLGVVVDGVESIENISEQEILPLPGYIEGGTDYLLGVVGRFPAILLMSAECFASGKDADILSQIAASPNWGQDQIEHTGGIKS